MKLRSKKVVTLRSDIIKVLESSPWKSNVRSRKSTGKGKRLQTVGHFVNHTRINNTFIMSSANVNNLPASGEIVISNDISNNHLSSNDVIIIAQECNDNITQTSNLSSSTDINTSPTHGCNSIAQVEDNSIVINWADAIDENTITLDEETMETTNDESSFNDELDSLVINTAQLFRSPSSLNEMESTSETSGTTIVNPNSNPQLSSGPEIKKGEQSISQVHGRIRSLENNEMIISKPKFDTIDMNLGRSCANCLSKVEECKKALENEKTQRKMRSERDVVIRKQKEIIKELNDRADDLIMEKQSMAEEIAELKSRITEMERSNDVTMVPASPHASHSMTSTPAPSERKIDVVEAASYPNVLVIGDSNMKRIKDHLPSHCVFYEGFFTTSELLDVLRSPDNELFYTLKHYKSVCIYLGVNDIVKRLGTVSQICMNIYNIIENLTMRGLKVFVIIPPAINYRHVNITSNMNIFCMRLQDSDTSNEWRCVFIDLFQYMQKYAASRFCEKKDGYHVHRQFTAEIAKFIAGKLIDKPLKISVNVDSEDTTNTTNISFSDVSEHYSPAITTKDVKINDNDVKHLSSLAKNFFLNTERIHECGITIKPGMGIVLSGRNSNIEACSRYIKSRIVNQHKRKATSSTDAKRPKMSDDKKRATRCKFQDKPDGCRSKACTFLHDDEHKLKKRQPVKKSVKPSKSNSSSQPSSSSQIRDLERRLDSQQAQINSTIRNYAQSSTYNQSGNNNNVRVYNKIAHYELQVKHRYTVNNSKSIEESTVCWDPNCTCK